MVNGLVYLEGISLHFAFGMVSEHLNVRPSINLLLRRAAAVGAALSVAVDGGAVTAAAIDDLIALFTREARTGGGTPLYGRLE